jgi:hypothetical protein
VKLLVGLSPLGRARPLDAPVRELPIIKSIDSLKGIMVCLLPPHAHGALGDRALPGDFWFPDGDGVSGKCMMKTGKLQLWSRR